MNITQTVISKLQYRKYVAQTFIYNPFYRTLRLSVKKDPYTFQV